MFGKLTNGIKRLARKVLYGEKCDSDTYVQFLRKNGCEVGDGCWFYAPRSTVIDPVRLDWISIGKNTKITRGVTILAHDYAPSVCVHTHKEILLAGGKYTSIGDNCFVGVNAIIMPGCRVGNNCIVGAGAVVATDIPDNSVCAGNPAKVIMSVEEYFQKRKRKYLEDAKRNVCHFQNRHGRLPNTKELNAFAMLYLERNEENYNKYFASYIHKDNDPEDIRKSFFDTEPIFESYEAFIDFCLSEQ